MSKSKTSDLRSDPLGEEPAPKKASQQILKSEIREARDALDRTVYGLFISGLSAGLDLGFSLLLMAVIWTQTHNRLPQPIVNILIANMYTVGFIFVVIGRSELFTEQTTLAVLPVLDRKESIGSLLRLWVIVYVSNLIGAAIFARLITLDGSTLDTISPQAFGAIAGAVVEHGRCDIFSSAILAGWLMGLLSWLVAAGRDTISQIVVVWLITTAIGLAGLHHCIAGSIEIMAGAFARQGITWIEVGGVVLYSTLGNIVGGVVFVAVIKYSHTRLFARQS